MSYATTALLAHSTYPTTNNPEIAWQNAAKANFPKSLSSQQKGCPKSTFLGLCSAGKLKGIPAGDYTRSLLNKRYALKAIELLKAAPSGHYNTATLWKAVLQHLKADPDKRHNSQMDVVLALSDKGLIKV